MTLEMIPDRPGREDAFEPKLDELLAIFCPDWVMPQIMEGEHRYHRCEVKRFKISEAADADHAAIRQHADLLIHTAMLDQCRSGVRQLIEPLVDALGQRRIQTAIIDYVRTGSYAEKVGATMAWYFARPGLRYGSTAGLRPGAPTEGSKAAQDALTGLRDGYRAACLDAFLACDDPEVRQDLSLGINLDPAAYPDHLQPSHQQARDIIMANPEHYRWLLQR